MHKPSKVLWLNYYCTTLPWSLVKSVNCGPVITIEMTFSHQPVENGIRCDFFEIESPGFDVFAFPVVFSDDEVIIIGEFLQIHVHETDLSSLVI